jgi:hypothetical protein
VSHSAAGAGDRDTVSGAQAAVNHEPLPRAQSRHRQRSRLELRQVRGLRRKHVLRNDGVLGQHTVAIERGEREDLVARLGDTG